MILNFQRTNPKMSIRPPLSITGVECPVPFSYNCENGFQIRPPASLRSVPFHSCRKLPMLRFASQRSNNAAGVTRHCTSLRPRRLRPLASALRFAPLPSLRTQPPSAKGTRFALLRSCSFPALPPKASGFALRIAPAAVGLPLRFASLYFT